MREEQLNVTATKGLVTISSSRVGRMHLLIRQKFLLRRDLVVSLAVITLLKMSTLHLQNQIRAGSPSTVSLEKTNIEGVSGESTKQILVIDDDQDSGLAIKACLETYYRPDPGLSGSAIQVITFIDPIRALLEFKPYYYDLLLVDINMSSVSGYELVEKIIKLNLNIKVCFMTSGEINYEAITEIRHPTKSFGCFIKKPASTDYLVNRVMQELY
jgi:CheY-like chemotaxis protein